MFTMPYFLLTLIVITIATKDSLMDPEKYVKIYSQCDPTPDSTIHKNNGLYYIKPSVDGMIIPVICSNGYTMIDLSLDTNLKSIPTYLSSYDYSRVSIDYIIPNLDDTATFREWWLPSDQNTKFRIAKDCKSCLDASDPLLSNNVVYYTDSSLFCYTSYIGNNACLDAVNAYSCNICDVGIFTQTANDINDRYWRQCSALQTSPDTPSWHEPQMRVNHHLIYRPVMSLLRRACTCYQQESKNKNEILKEYIVAKSELPLVTYGTNNIKAGAELMDNIQYIDDNIRFQAIHVADDESADNDMLNKCAENKIYLTQNDFLTGTYRIRDCGEYIFTQDIICNFNAPTHAQELDLDFSPNSIDNEANELYWFPTREQASKDNSYPGLYDFIGSFSLGFFSGITVETDDVIINLNGFTFSMHRKFYVQQRFFSLIEMASKMFEPLQGPTAWGLYNEYYAKNLEIKGPGTLATSSHHAIHGNLAQNVYIHDLNIKHFDVAGISCNGCSFLTIENVVVGPQNKDIPTLGRYTQARAFLPRLKHLNDKFGDEFITFYNRNPIQISQLCSRMVQEMDMIYFNYINNKQYDDISNLEWIAAKKIFLNPSGWMDGGSSYGISINGRGAAVVGIGVRTDSVNNIILRNVEIFGIYNQAKEKIKYQLPADDEKNNGQEATTRGILFDAIDWIAVSDQIEDRMKSQYVGDCYTDIQFAAAKFVDSWYFRNSYFVGQSNIDYVFKGNNLETDYPFLKILPQRNENDYYEDVITRSCGTDIQLHSSKGAIGLMINGAQDSIIDDVFIHDIYNFAALGSTICGPYDLLHITFEDIDIQKGYTATRAHGLVIDFASGEYTNIHIDNIQSKNGEANGFTIYKGSDVQLLNINVENVYAGTELTEEDANQLVLPNYVPRACSMDIHENTQVEYVTGTMSDNLVFGNIDGFIVCDPFNDESDSNDGGILSSNTVLFALVMGIFIFLMIIIYWNRNPIFKTNKTISENTPLLNKNNDIEITP